MKVWKEYEEHQVTHSMAHYLMTIEELLRAQGYCRVTDVARHLEITPGSASISLKALKKKGWVEEDHNRFLRLSVEGGRIAADVRANNRILATFLTEVLEVSEAQAHIDSCKLEHLVSSETRTKLLSFLHFIHSKDPSAADFIKAWHEHKDSCPGLDACDVCQRECMFNAACSVASAPGTHAHAHAHPHGHSHAHSHANPAPTAPPAEAAPAPKAPTSKS